MQGKMSTYPLGWACVGFNTVTIYTRMNVASQFTSVFIYFLNRISTRQARDSKRQRNQNVSFVTYKQRVLRVLYHA